MKSNIFLPLFLLILLVVSCAKEEEESKFSKNRGKSGNVSNNNSSSNDTEDVPEVILATFGGAFVNSANSNSYDPSSINGPAGYIVSLSDGKINIADQVACTTSATPTLTISYNDDVAYMAISDEPFFFGRNWVSASSSYEIPIAMLSSSSFNELFIKFATAGGLESMPMKLGVAVDENCLEAPIIFNTNIDSGGAYNFNTIAISSNGNIFGSNYSELFRSTDGGATFDSIHQWTNYYCESSPSIYTDNQNVILACSYSYGNTELLVSNDNGETFHARTQADGLGSELIRDFISLNGTMYFATSYNYENTGVNGISVSTDNGSELPQKHWTN